jgi:glycosyltransferase involved in cell wall biosynthesis
MMLSPSMAFGADWAAAARSAADEVIVVVQGAGATKKRVTTTSYGDDLATDGWVDHLRLRPTGLLGPLSRQVSSRRIARCVEAIEAERGPVDLIHAHTYQRASLLPAVKRATGVRYVVTEHSSRLTVDAAAHKPVSRRGLALARQAYRDAEEVLAVSRYLCESLERHHLPGRMRVVGNPVDVDLFRHRRGPPSNTKQVIATGRLAPEKQPSLILQAFAIAHRRDRSLRLTFLGDGPERTELERETRSRELGSVVEVAGRVPRQVVAERLASAHVLALASTVETFCVAGAEALSCGVPIVVPNVAAAPELVDTPQDGLVVAQDDVAALSHAMLQAAAMPPDGRRPRAERAARRFSIDAVGQMLRSVYTDARAKERPEGEP